MSAAPTGIVVSVLCPEDDLDRYCRRLAATVSQGPMHLASVVAMGSQVYPVRRDTSRGTATLLRCEFRMRRAGASLDPLDSVRLLDRLAALEVISSHLVDARGADLGPVEPHAVAS